MPASKPIGPRPTAQEVAARLQVLKHVIGLAMTSLPRPAMHGVLASATPEQKEQFEKEAIERQKNILGNLKKNEMLRFISPTELTFLHANAVTMTSKQQIDASWRLEAEQVLVWAVGLIDSIPPYDKSANADFINVIPMSIGEFVNQAKLRPVEQIDRARKIAEFWHWRSRTRQLIERGDKFPSDSKFSSRGITSYDTLVRDAARQGASDGGLPPLINDDFPALGKAYRDLSPQEWSKVRSITMERHFALNWLCGYAPGNKWDETPTDT